jgi:ABC-type glutathione transport system ATPase component
VTTAAAPPLLEARDLTVQHARRAGWWRPPAMHTALRNVSLMLARGERLAVVGESGSGKSTLLRALLRLVVPQAGQVLIAGTDLAILTPRELRQQRRVVQVVFQDPLASLDPRMSVQQIVVEPLRQSGAVPDSEWMDRASAQLTAVGLDARYLQRRPAQLSGGQAQRVALARALIAEPAVLLCDEPVSALDVSLRAQVLQLLSAQCAERSLALLFVTHDLHAARHLCQRVLVLQQGEVVESGATRDVFARPQHPYTQGLLASMLSVNAESRRA